MNPHDLGEPAASRAGRPRGRATARYGAVRYAAVLALVGSLLAPGPAAAQDDGMPWVVPDLTPADPVFKDGAAVTLSIAEGHADGAVVGTVDATDANDDTLTYSLSGTDAASFAIDAATGEISVAAGVVLDLETKSAHSVTVGVSDGKDAEGGAEADPTQDAAIAVTIEVTAAPDDGARGVPDLTPADPVFKDGAAVTLSIAEGHADGAVVGTVDATDANDDTLTYSLSGTDAASFAIDAATGEISVAAGVVLDLETKSTYSVTVGVSDGKDAEGGAEADPTQDAAIAVTIEVTAAPDDGDGDDTDDGGDQSPGDEPPSDGASGDDGAAGAFSDGDGPTGAQEPTRPAGCVLTSQIDTPVMATPVATSSTISVTFTVNNSQYAWSLHICDSSGKVWTATDASSAVIGGAAGTRTGTHVVHGGVDASDAMSTFTLEPNSDYWLGSQLTNAGASAWQYVRTPEPTRPMGCAISGSTPSGLGAFDTPVATSSTISLTTARGLGSYTWKAFLCDSSGMVWNATDSSSAVIEGTAQTPSGNTYVVHGGVDPNNSNSTTTIMASSDYWVTVRQAQGGQFSWQYVRTPAGAVTRPAGCGITGDDPPGNIDSISATDSTISAVMQSPTGYGWQMRICDSAGQIWAATDSAGAKIEGPTRNFDDNPATFVIHGGVNLRDSLITFDIAASSDYWVCFGGPSNQDTFAFRCQYIRTAPPVPAVESVAFSSDPGGGGLYALGEHVEVTLTFDESVTVTGTPRLKIKLADTTGATDERWANYSSGSPGTALVFRYTPVAADASTGVAVVENSLELNSGTINSTASSETAALLPHVGLGHDTGHQIDTVAPTVTSVVVRDGERIVYLLFSEDMDQTSVPHPTQIAYVVDNTQAAVQGFVVFAESDVSRFATTSPLASTQVGKVGYSYDSNNANHAPLKDVAGNLLAIQAAKTVSIVSDPAFDDGETREITYPEAAGLLNKEFSVVATDVDGDTLTYAFGSRDEEISRVDASAGKFRFASVGDFETRVSYEATLEVTDGKDPYGRAQETATVDDTIAVTVTITDVDEPPGVPTGLSSSAQSSSTVTLGWTAPAVAAGTHPPPLTGYDVRYFAGAMDPSDPADWVEPGEEGGHSHSGTGTTSVVSGLSASTAYRFQVRAVNHEGVSAWTSSVSGTTTNQPTIALSVSPASLGEDADSIAVTVKATRAAAEATAASVVTLSVDSTSTATSGTDYVALGTLETISLAANETEKSVSVNIDPIQDTTSESGGETIVFAGSATGGFAVTSATFTIDDDDTPSTSWTLTATPATLCDGVAATLCEGAAATAVTVKAELDGGTLASAVTVTFADFGGTAERGGTKDYAATDSGGTAITKPASLTITAGTTEASTTIRIAPVGDNLDESDGTTERPHETIVLSGTATGGLTTVETATVMIVDDDTASTNISLSTSPGSFREDAAETTVTVTATLAGTATYTTAQSVAVSVVSAGTTGATPGADAMTGDYRLKNFADAAVTAVTLPISLGSVTIPVGMLSGTETFKVTPNNDSTSEGVEVIRLGGSLADFTVSQANINLVDDDLPPLTLTSTTSSVGEGDTSATSVTVRAAVEDNTAAKVDVTLTFTGGATSADYTLNPATVTLSILSGQKTGTATFTITPINDRLTEGGESIIIGGSHDDYTVVPVELTLSDDDAASTQVLLTVDADPDTDDDQTSIGEGDGAKTVTVKAELNDGTLDSNVTVTFGALAGSAMGGGVDYTASPAKPMTLTITAGTVEASTTITITPNDDDIDEGTGENISFGAALGGALSSTVTAKTLRINDNDTASSAVNLTLSPAAVGEGAAETAVTVTATVQGTKTHDTAIAVPVVVAARSGNSATAGTDYTLKDFDDAAVTALTLPISLGTITIPKETLSATATLKIDPTEDTDFEGTESDAHEYVRVAAGTVTGFTVNHADLEITENDNPTITLVVDTDRTTTGVQDRVSESAGSVSTLATLTLDDGARSTNTSVALTFGGTATRGPCTTDGNDYEVNPHSRTINANRTSISFALGIKVCEDRDTEGAQTIIINGTAAGFDVAGATVTIDDNDSESTSLTIKVDTDSGTTGDQSDIGEGLTGTRTVTVKAELDGGTVSDDVTVTFDALAGTAVRAADTTSGDYTSNPAKPDAVTITAGTLSASTTISIDPRDDMIDEDDETITIDASAVRDDTSSTVLSVTEGSVTITDNDTATLTLSLDADPGTAGMQTSVAEDGGAVTVRATATLSLVRSADTALDLGLGGTAAFSTLPRDYLPPLALLDRATDVTITAGATSDTFDFEITPVDERFDDGDKTINVRNFTDRFGFVESNTINLVDDDAPSTLVTLTVDTDTDTDGIQSAVGEGDSASVLVTATLNDAVRNTATTVTLTFGGTAKRGTDKDYTLSGTLSVVIPQGEVSGQRTITVTPVDERVDDGDKTVIFGGEAPTGSGLSVSNVTIDITDNDDPPTALKVKVAPAILREQGPAGGGDCTDSTNALCKRVKVTAEFTGTNSDVTLTAPVSVRLSVHSTSTTNTAGTVDYTAPSALGDAAADITIAMGQTSGEVTVEFTSRQDEVAEGSETIVIDAAAGGFTVAAADRATITLTDDDVAADSLTLSATFSDGSRLHALHENAVNDSVGGVTAIITAELDGKASTSAVNVTFSILMAPDRKNATRGADKDYTASDNLTDTMVDITIAATKTSNTTTVVLDPHVDFIEDNDEIIRIGGSATGAITTVNPLDIPITNDERASTRVALTRSSGPPSFTEDHGTGVPYRITATLAGGIARDVATPVTLSFEGTAAAGADCNTDGVDYTASPAAAVITIAAEARTGEAAVTLTPCNDEIPETPKTIAVRGSADFGGDTGTRPVASGFDVSLVDDDLPIITLTAERVSPAGPPHDSVREGDRATFRITAERNTAETTQRVAVPLGVLVDDSSAVEGVDYRLSGTRSITIADGAATGTRDVTVSTLQDQLVEGDETIVLGGQIGDGTEFGVAPVTLTITDDDVTSTEITLTANPSSLAERQGTRRVTLTAELNGAPRTDGAIEVSFAVDAATSTATSGDDYTLAASNPTTITIPVGQTLASETITIEVVGDDIDEGDSETIVIAGSVAGLGSDLDVNNAQIEITDDDTASTVIDLFVDIDRDTDGDQSSVGEGAGAVNVVVTGRLRGTKSHDTDNQVGLTFTGGTATSGTDYTSPSLPGSVTFRAGRLAFSFAFIMTPTPDSDIEGAETFEIRAAATGFTVWGAALTIVDDDIDTGDGHRDLPGQVRLDAPARPSGATSARLSWSAPANPPDADAGRPGGYRVERRSASAPQWVAVADVEANPSRYTITDPPDPDADGAQLLDPGEDYQWRVTAYVTALPVLDADGNPVLDPDGNITTAACGAATVGCAATPSEPREPAPPRPTSIGGGGGGGAPPERDTDLPDPSRPQPPPRLLWNRLPADVAAESVHADGIMTVFRLGIMTLVEVEPDPDAEVRIARGFAPERAMSRADVAAPLVRLWQVLEQDCPAADTAERFDDIDDLQVAADAVCLRGLGVTNGTTATTYSPERLVTRAQTASLLIRVWRLLDLDCPAGEAPPFEDVAADSVHRDNILCLRGLGITAGTSASTFSPDRHVTRAEFATMLARLYHLANPPAESEPEVEVEPSRPQPPTDPVALPADMAAESAHTDGVLAVLGLGVMTLVGVDPGPGADPAAPAVMGFAPGRSMSRADLAAPLVRLWRVLDQDCPADDTAERFEDIDDLQVAADAVCLRGLGVTNGTTATTYSPERLVTRAQTASLLVRVWRLLDLDCPADDAPPFEDVAADSVHRDNILCLRGLGITAGTSASTFTPGRHVTRAEFATMLTRLYNLINPPPESESAPAGQSSP